MTKTPEEQALHHFGTAYASMVFTGASEETLQSYVQDILKNKPKIVTKEVYRIYRIGSKPPFTDREFDEREDAINYLCGYYPEHYVNGVSKHPTSHKFWGLRFAIKKETTTTQ